MGYTRVDPNVLDHWHSVVRTLTVSPKTLIGGISVALVSWGGSTLIVRGISFDESAALLLELSLPIPNPPAYRNCQRKTQTQRWLLNQNVVTLGPAVRVVPLFPCSFIDALFLETWGRLTKFTRRLWDNIL